MNQTFSFQRFLLMLRLEIAEKGRTHFLMAAVLVAALLLMMLPIIFSKEHNGTLDSLHIIAMIILVLLGGSLYTNQVFNQYDSSNSAIAALVIPASRLEKFLSTLFLNLLFILPFTLIYVGLLIWTRAYANNHLLAGEEKYEEISGFIPYFLILMSLVIQGVAFLGAIYFTKAAYIKTAAALFVTVVIGFTFNHAIAESMTSSPTWISASPFMDWTMQFAEADQYYSVEIPEPLQYFVYVLPILVLLAFWYISYVRLTEKEV